MATNIGTKRKRDPTFLASEKMALLKLVQKNFHLIENKKTDAASTKKKIDQWQRIAIEFNVISRIYPRKWQTLKSCWENIKKRANQKNREGKEIEDPAIGNVLDLINTHDSVNMYDSDGMHISASFTVTDNNVMLHTDDDNSSNKTNAFGNGNEQTLELEDDNNIHVNVSSTQAMDSIEVPATETVDWSYSKYSPSMLKRPIHPALRTAPDEQHNETQEQWQKSTNPIRTNEKVKTEHAANSFAREESSIRLNILRLQEEREQEKLAQEQIKTEQERIKLEILEIELKSKLSGK